MIYRMFLTQTILMAALLLNLGMPVNKLQDSQRPRWSYSFDLKTRSLTIEVSTKGLQSYQVMSKGICEFHLLDSDGKYIGNKEFELRTPIRSAQTSSQTFALTDTNVNRVNGKQMKWEIKVDIQLGIADEVISGESPPDKN